MTIIEIVKLIASLTRAVQTVTIRLNDTVRLFEKMNAEGREKLTAEEERQMVATRDAARNALVAEIDK